MNKNTIIKILFVTITYFFLACVSEYLFDPQHTFFTIRLAPGFGLVAVFIGGMPALIGVFLGELLYFSFLHYAEITNPILLILAINAVLYVFIGSKLIQRYVEQPNHLSNASDCFKFFLLGGFVASLVPSLFSVYSISLIEPAVQQSFIVFLGHWWLGQVLGVLIIAPLTLCLMWKAIPVWKARIPVVPVFLSMLLIVIMIAYSYVTITEKEKLESLLVQKSLSISSSIKLQMSNYEESLYSIKSLLEYTPDIEPHEFEVYSDKIITRQPSIPAISFQKLIKVDERQAYEDRMRKLYSDNFQITERDGSGKFIRAAEREEYTPITMRSFYDKNAKIMGFDTSTSMYSKSAREEARTTNTVSVSRAFKLVSSNKGNKSVVLYLPLSNEGLFSGYVSLSVYVGKAIKTAIENINMEGIYLNIWDDSVSENNIIYFNSKLKPDNKLKISNTSKINFVSHDWVYELIPDSIFLLDLIKSQLLIIVFCILLVSVTTIRLLEFTGKRHELSRRVYESEEHSRLLLDSTAEAIYGLDLDGNCTFCNAACLRILGFESEEDLLGQHMHELIHHTHADGSTYAVEDCQIYKSFVKNEKSHVVTEVLFRKDNSQFPVEYWSYPINRDGKTVGSVVTFLDITDRIQAREKLSYQSSHDALTGLVNRKEFEHRAQDLLATVNQSGVQHALCFVDLDQFKIVNDTCGHTAGDEMLHQLGSALANAVRDGDTLARLGGDEFGVLMESCSIDDAYTLASELLMVIQNYQFSWEGHSFKVGVSIGLVAMTESTKNLNQLLKDVDAACYMAKDKGRNRIHIYHAEDSEIVERYGEMQWVAKLNAAFEENLFCLYAQSIVPLDDSTDTHYELLIRMFSEDKKIISPGKFLPAAERYNLITQLDRWVVTHAFKLLLDQPQFLKQVNFISINISGPSLADPEFLNFVYKEFMETKLTPEKICFEITETAAISNLNMANLFISLMKELGCRFALDDFGSGLSSFGYLKNLPVDYLKIDGMFVKDIVEDKIDHAMVKSINDIGHVMGMKTIAEFVENDFIKGMLKEIGVDYVQGYGIGRPQPFDELLKRSNNVVDIINVKDDGYGL